MYCAIVIKHVAFFIIWAKFSGIHMYSLPLNLYTSVFGCGCGFGFEKKNGKTTDLEKKRHGAGE